MYISWTGTSSSEINKFLHIILQGILSLMAGLLMNRFEKHKEQMEAQQYLTGLGKASAAIAHDLKNPLITILAYTKRIIDKKGDQGNALNVIASSAYTMQKIIHDVLDFSRPLQLNLKKENVYDMVDRAAQTCMEKASGANVTLSISRNDMPIFFVIDGCLIERALSNLISNAIEASESGSSITITIVPGYYPLQVKIKDQGSGMDRKTLEHIFIPFYTRRNGGTGLGMAIAKKIITEHNGNINIRSKAGAGTEVTVELPYQDKGKEGQYIQGR
jgi:two-component system sensor histidine kinase HydH